MSGWRKLFVGPLRRYSCESCGKRVSLHRFSMAVVLLTPFTLLVFANQIATPWIYAVVGALLVLSLLALVFIVPLVPFE